MSQSPPNYIDGVPVKISENYRPPPIIHLPQPTRHRLERREQPTVTREYEFTLELSVLAKIAEWRTARDREDTVRRERMLTREQERRRMLEERQKALLTQVSYPSAEDLSSEDELPGETTQVVTERHSTPQGHFSPPTNFDTILMPTVLPESTCQGTKRAPKSPYSAKINYSDFESDTSSPFDNLELKTINDLDILAQVLKGTVSLEDTTNESTEAPQNRVALENVQNSNDSFAQTLAQVSYDMDNISTQVYATPAVQQPQYLNYQTDNYVYPAYGALMNGGYYYSSYGNPNAFTAYPQPPPQPAESAPDRLKSKSVPDIAQELSSEVQRHSEKRRIRNNSQTIESPCEDEPKNTRKSHKSETFTQLSKSSQKLAATISTMGFPLDRVSRVTQALGNDDKKIVDHLIPLSELLDLGFEEAKISEALLKFDNNKERALDFLIS
ncbi:ubiquitin-associated protein 1 [Phlebotomus argentipes]|uniref:ubiquitin-associated protein 1 n=1 Tax=Phlebotomus argentipes TaxID=94469 RepID=UPI0028931B61|nr:ubiquitin-associated protein 1 [Phlebotomus argentipes]